MNLKLFIFFLLLSIITCKSKKKIKTKNLDNKNLINSDDSSCFEDAADSYESMANYFSLTSEKKIKTFQKFNLHMSTEQVDGIHMLNFRFIIKSEGSRVPDYFIYEACKAKDCLRGESSEKNISIPTPPEIYGDLDVSYSECFYSQELNASDTCLSSKRLRHTHPKNRPSANLYNHIEIYLLKEKIKSRVYQLSEKVAKKTLSLERPQTGKLAHYLDSSNKIIKFPRKAAAYFSSELFEEDIRNRMNLSKKNNKNSLTGESIPILSSERNLYGGNLFSINNISKLKVITR